MIQGLGERLKSCREKSGLSQRTVADKLCVSAGLVSDYENGHRTPSAEKLVRLADIYNCSIDFLVGRNRSNDIYIVNSSKLKDKEKEAIAHLIDTFTKDR